MGNCYGRETWCHIDHQTGFINWLSRHIHKWKSAMGWITSFFVLKNEININFIDCLCFFKFVYVYCSLYLFCFILQAVSTVLFTTSSWFFCLLLFKYVIHTWSTTKPKTLPAVCADLVNPWISRNTPTYFWRCDVWWGQREIAYYSCDDTQNKGCFVPVTADNVRIKLRRKFCRMFKI